MPSCTAQDFRFTGAFLDPASGKKDQAAKKVRARSAIVVGSIDCHNRIFIRKSWAERCSTARLYDEIYKTNSEFRLDVFGIEANAQQSLFVDLLAINAAQRKIQIPIRGVTQPTSLTKEFRVRTSLQPAFNDGRILMLESQSALKEEILSFPLGDTCDIVDALASLVRLMPKNVSTNPEDKELQARLRYLRESGAPASYIERVANRTEDKPKALGIDAFMEQHGFN